MSPAPPWTTGERTIRGCLIDLLDMPAQVGAEIGIQSAQYVALKAGADVVVTKEQLSMFNHSQMPALTAESYTLSGDNTLTAIT